MEKLSAASECISQSIMMDFKGTSTLLCMQFSVEGKRPHTELSSSDKCRSAMIFNKRSLNFILVFLTNIFVSSPLVDAIKERKKKTFHSTFCFVCAQSAIRIDMWFFFFGEISKIIRNKTKKLYPDTAVKIHSTHKRDIDRPTRM